MTDPARALAEIKRLRDQPDLTQHEYGLIDAIEKTIRRMDHTPLLSERIDIQTMLDEMFLAFRPVWERYHRPSIGNDNEVRYEDDPEALKPERRAVA